MWQEQGSRQSDLRWKTPDSAVCCASVDKLMGAARLESLTTGNVRCGSTAVHQVSYRAALFCIQGGGRLTQLTIEYGA